MGTTISSCPHLSLPTVGGPVAGGGDVAPTAGASPDLTAAIQSLSVAVSKLAAVVDAMAGASALGGGAPGKGALAVIPAGDTGAQAAPVAASAAVAPAPAPAAVAAAAAAPPTPAPAPVAAPPPTPPGSAPEKLILPVGDVPVTSGFGANEALRGGVAHTGTDYAAPAGTPIKAAASGTVTFSGVEAGGGGNVIIIDHGNGMKTLYAHQSERIAKVGDVVKQGDVIGKVGMTGAATGNHLHFEVIKGARGPGEVDPVAFMASGGTV